MLGFVGHSERLGIDSKSSGIEALKSLAWNKCDLISILTRSLLMLCEDWIEMGEEWMFA